MAKSAQVIVETAKQLAAGVNRPAAASRILLYLDLTGRTQVRAFDDDVRMTQWLATTYGISDVLRII
jgi:hypothetical protein